MSLTSRQTTARGAWRRAKWQREIAAPGERDRTAAQLRAAATEVLRSDIAARKSKTTRRAA